MLRQAEPTRQLQDWLDRLAPLVAEAQATLRAVEPGKLALRSGCTLDAGGDLHLSLFRQEYVVAGSDFAVRQADTGKETSSFTQCLILTYLVTADGTTPSGRWVSFRELPDGLFYAQAFQGYSGDRLVRELEGGIAAFRRAAEALGGELLEIGDAGYAFIVLPRVHLAVVYWQGDEEFPSQAQVLFEDTTSHYMPTDGLAVLGSQLVGRLLKAAR
jgi:hypothetical protein